MVAVVLVICSKAAVGLDVVVLLPMVELLLTFCLEAPSGDCDVHDLDVDVDLVLGLVDEGFGAICRIGPLPLLYVAEFLYLI